MSKPFRWSKVTWPNCAARLTVVNFGPGLNQSERIIKSDATSTLKVRKGGLPPRFHLSLMSKMKRSAGASPLPNLETLEIIATSRQTRYQPSVDPAVHTAASSQLTLFDRAEAL